MPACDSSSFVVLRVEQWTCGCAWLGVEQISMCPTHEWPTQLELPF